MKTSKPTVAALIAVHNRLALTRRCLFALRESAPASNLSVTVVDDGSTDGTAEALRAEFPEVKVLPGDGGLWFGGAIDKALRLRLLESEPPEYVLILNNDTFPAAGSVDKMISWSEGRKAVAASFYVEDRQENGTAGFFWRFPKGLSSACHAPEWRDLVGANASPVVRVDSVATTFTLYPSKSLRGFQNINLRRHPHNRYDVMLSMVVRGNGCVRVVTKEPMGSHLYGTQARYRSCKEMSLAEFISYSWNDPKLVSYFPGCLELAFKSAPNLLFGIGAGVRSLTFYTAQLLVCAVNTALRRRPSCE